MGDHFAHTKHMRIFVFSLFFIVVAWSLSPVALGDEQEGAPWWCTRYADDRDGGGCEATRPQCIALRKRLLENVGTRTLACFFQNHAFCVRFQDELKDDSLWRLCSPDLKGCEQDEGMARKQGHRIIRKCHRAVS